MKNVPFTAIDNFHTTLMDDDQFNEAMMRVAIQVAEQQGLTGEDVYDLANELCCRISVA